jgi:hypothetical protein
MSTQRQANVTLSKPGMNLGTWATRSGGDPDRDMTDFYPGGLQTVRKIPGNPSPSGGGFSWRGMIKTVQIPPMSDSNDAAVIGIVISPSNVPTYA